MATKSAPSEIIERQRKKLLKILQEDPDSILDTLTSRGLISEEDYETLDKVTDPLKKSRRLLILVQKKGEVSCQCFLKSLFSTFPETATSWGLKQELLKHKDIVSPQYMVVNKNSENISFPGKKKIKNPEITMSSEDKEHLDLKISAFSRDKKTGYQETALAPRETEKKYDTPKITGSHSVKRVEYEIPTTVTYLKDGQRYEEPDDSLYLGEEEYPDSVGYMEDAETTVEDGDYDVPQHIVYHGREDSECSESTGFSDEHICECTETTSMSLEERDKHLEERRKLFKDVLSCLNMDRSRKILPDFIKQFSLDHGCRWTPETPADLAWNFLMKVRALDVTARDSIPRQRVLYEDSKEELLSALEKLEIRDIRTINPLDVLCASMLCSDSSLQREVMSNMYQCRFALPLLLPDLENNKSILMLGAMKGIVRKQSTQSNRDAEKFLSLMKMPVISFVRLGHCSFSKSRILNALLSPDQLKSHQIFLHQDLSVPVLPRQISDGLVEMTWCFPNSDDRKESPSIFQKPVAVANLHGDLESFWTQFEFLVKVSTAVFFFTDSLSEKEWGLLMFLGKAAIQRYYFVFSPQARVREEAQIFKRTLKLKSSQLLFWDGEEAGDRRKNLEGLQAALQEVISSPLRCVSVEDMACLARELGIQVDQDFESAQVIQVFPNMNMAGIVEGEGQQRRCQSKSSSENPALRLIREPRARCEVSQNFQNCHHSPVFVPHLEKCWPSPTRIGSEFNHVSLETPWIMSSHLGSEKRSKWLCTLSIWNSRFRKKGKDFGIQCSQPRKFYSGERFTKFSNTYWEHHLNGTFGRPPRPIYQPVWACPERPQTRGALEKFGAVASLVGHLHSLTSQLGEAVGKPQPGQGQAPKLNQLTGRFMRTAPHIKDPYPQCFQSTGNIQKLVRPAAQQESQLIAQGPSNPVFQTGSHSVSKSKLIPSSQFKSHQTKPSQVKHFQPKPSPPVSSQPKLSQTRAPRPQSSQVKPSHPRPIQPKLSQTHPSQTRAYQPRAGSKRVGKH